MHRQWQKESAVSIAYRKTWLRGLYGKKMNEVDHNSTVLPSSQGPGVVDSSFGDIQYPVRARNNHNHRILAGLK
jgi:hypothetical protein